MMKKTLLLLLALLFCTPANAQPNDPLKLIYKSQEGVRPAFIFADGFESGDVSSLLDATGNGKSDLVLTSEDDAGNLKDLLVIDGTSLGAALVDTIYWIQDVHETLGMSDIYPVSFFGFADPFGSGVPHAIFHNEQDVRFFSPDNVELIVKWSWRETQSGGSVRLLSVTDITNDSLPDVILFLPQTKQVQVWSKP